MAESGFISLELSRSQAPVTISKTAILFAEADNDTPESTHLHCVGGITHTVMVFLTILQNYFRDSLRRTVGIMVSPQWLSMTGMFHTLKKATMLLLLFTSQNQAQV